MSLRWSLRRTDQIDRHDNEETRQGPAALKLESVPVSQPQQTSVIYADFLQSTIPTSIHHVENISSQHSLQPAALLPQNSTTETEKKTEKLQSVNWKDI